MSDTLAYAIWFYLLISLGPTVRFWTKLFIKR